MAQGCSQQLGVVEKERGREGGKETEKDRLGKILGGTFFTIQCSKENKLMETVI